MKILVELGNHKMEGGAGRNNINELHFWRITLVQQVQIPALGRHKIDPGLETFEIYARHAVACDELPEAWMIKFGEVISLFSIQWVESSWVGIVSITPLTR